MEQITIIVDARDRFSTTETCVETLLANTPQPYDLIVVMGGAPSHLQRLWKRRFAQAKWIFDEGFLNQAEARNHGLREAGTRLAVLMDNDNYVRPGWLEPLLRAQQETGAVLVTPLILEPPRRIHTAGNDLYITYERGQAYGYKHLRYHGMVYSESSNLTRQQSDYAELHCQLVEVEPTLRLGANDERILEVGEVDQGLTFAKAGRQMWCEPSSIVFYALGCPLQPEDIPLFVWRWHIGRVHEGYQYFQRKWELDISEYGTFREWLVRYNNQLGLLPRLWPSATSLVIDRELGRLRECLGDLCRIPQYRLQRFKRRLFGYDEWTSGVQARH